MRYREVAESRPYLAAVMGCLDRGQQRKASQRGRRNHVRKCPGSQAAVPVFGMILCKPPMVVTVTRVTVTRRLGFLRCGGGDAARSRGPDRGIPAGAGRSGARRGGTRWYPSTTQKTHTTAPTFARTRSCVRRGRVLALCPCARARACVYLPRAPPGRCRRRVPSRPIRERDDDRDDDEDVTRSSRPVTEGTGVSAGGTGQIVSLQVPRRSDGVGGRKILFDAGSPSNGLTDVLVGRGAVRLSGVTRKGSC